MIDPIAFFSRDTAAVMARRIEDSGLPAGLAATLRVQGVVCAGRLLGVTTRQLLQWHEQGTLTTTDLDQIDEAICRLSADLAAAQEKTDAENF